ncbi:MAG: hypothetical protein D6732_11610 [Methanobacteriota archaeon]|nr:MAG: hypothetical protein D6732_11610 [Euryarchaeota archaeon]
MRFDPEKIKEMKHFNQKLVLSPGQRVFSYAVQAMFEQIMSRIDIDAYAMYGIIWKAVIDFHEKEKLEYIHGNNMTVEERIRRTKGVHRLIENFLIDALEDPAEANQIRIIMVDIFDEYKKKIAYRDT